MLKVMTMMTNVLQQLSWEELSPDQYKQLNEREEITLSAIANIIKETKIDYGIEFLPRTLVVSLRSKWSGQGKIKVCVAVEADGGC